MDITIYPLRLVVNSANVAAQNYCYDCGILHGKFAPDIIKVVNHFILEQIFKQIKDKKVIAQWDHVYPLDLAVISKRIVPQVNAFVRHVIRTIPQWFVVMDVARETTYQDIAREYGDVWDQVTTAIRNRPRNLAAIRKLAVARHLAACGQALTHDYDFIRTFDGTPGS